MQHLLMRYCKSPNPLSIVDSDILPATISDHMTIFAALNFKLIKTYTNNQK